MEKNQGSNEEKYIKNTENLYFPEDANGHSESECKNGWLTISFIIIIQNHRFNYFLDKQNFNTDGSLFSKMNVEQKERSDKFHEFAFGVL